MELYGLRLQAQGFDMDLIKSPERLWMTAGFDMVIKFLIIIS